MGEGDAEMNLQDLCNEIMNFFLGTNFFLYETFSNIK